MKKVKRFSMYAVLILFSVLVLLPLLVIISSSFKNEMEIFSFPFRFIPKAPTFDNFYKLIDSFPLYTLNSLKVTVLIVVVQLVTATMAGYAFSKLRFRCKKILFLLYLCTLMLPIQVYIIPQVIIVSKIGLYDTHAALIIVSSFTAFGIFLAKQFFTTIPDSIIESARIDGAGHFLIFTRIVLPLSKPVITTIIVFTFRWFWNDFFVPLIYLISEHLKTLPLGLADFSTQYFTYYGPQMAASMVTIIPVMIVFLFAQKYFIQGVATSGIKA